MKAVVGDNPFDAPLTDGELFLTQFLGNDRCGSVWVVKALSNDAADDCRGTPVVGFWAGLGRQQRRDPAFIEGCEQLVVALAAVIELRGNLGDILFGAFAEDEHGQMTPEGIIVTDFKGAARAFELRGLGMDGKVHNENKGW